MFEYEQSTIWSLVSIDEGLLNKLPVFLPSSQIGLHISDLAMDLNSVVENDLLS
jgi:hypothetical protein